MNKCDRCQKGEDRAQHEHRFLMPSLLIGTFETMPSINKTEIQHGDQFLVRNGRIVEDKRDAAMQLGIVELSVEQAKGPTRDLVDKFVEPAYRDPKKNRIEASRCKKTPVVPRLTEGLPITKKKAPDVKGDK